VSEYLRNAVVEINEWLTVRQAADRLGLSVNAVKRAIVRGQLASEIDRKSRARIVRRRDVDGFVERCRLQPGDLDHLDPYPRPKPTLVPDSRS
jgi:excisionase family DNA binding protein